jgi:hypothetical protein
MQKLSSGRKLKYPPLPPGVDLKTVYADFLGFLYRATGEYICNTSLMGEDVWEALSHEVEFVFAIPNGWDTRQQGFLRDAAIQGGLFSGQYSEDRINFISEAEASVHFALAHSNCRDWLRPGIIFAILDAGGSTVDTTLYRCKAMRPQLRFEEVRASECVQVGCRK